MPRFFQYGESSQTGSSFTPLLELHERQQGAMFSHVMVRASLTMSQLGRLPNLASANPKTTPQ
jgi:hypothetical protein